MNRYNDDAMKYSRMWTSRSGLGPIIPWEIDHERLRRAVREGRTSALLRTAQAMKTGGRSVCGDWRECCCYLGRQSSDEGAVRNTKDVDILLEPPMIWILAVQAMNAEAGFDHGSCKWGDGIPGSRKTPCPAEACMSSLRGGEGANPYDLHRGSLR